LNTTLGRPVKAGEQQVDEHHRVARTGVAAEEDERATVAERPVRLTRGVLDDRDVEGSDGRVGDAMNEPPQQLPVPPLERGRAHQHARSAAHPQRTARHERQQLAQEVGDYDPDEDERPALARERGGDARDEEQHGREHEGQAADQHPPGDAQRPAQPRRGHHHRTLSSASR
jgi:hypothetical protein